MPTISFSYSVFEDALRLYAIGARDMIVQAVENSFAKHGFEPHKTENHSYTHFPGGWFDRATSAYGQFSVQNGAKVDRFSLGYEYTNHPQVSLLTLGFYFKKNLWNPKRRHDELLRFIQGVEQEFDSYEIPLISKSDWNRFVSENPEFRCAPTH